MFGSKRLRQRKPIYCRSVGFSRVVRQNLNKDYRKERHLALINQRDVVSIIHRHVDLVGVQIEVMREKLLLTLFLRLL